MCVGVQRINTASDAAAAEAEQADEETNNPAHISELPFDLGGASVETPVTSHTNRLLWPHRRVGFILSETGSHVLRHTNLPSTHSDHSRSRLLIHDARLLLLVHHLLLLVLWLDKWLLLVIYWLRNEGLLARRLPVHH